ncbi:MAG: hypothetical protein N2652_02650 [Kiritimatiellae bacterium]|nr:hypothetical protein [Kiritimatiellia bacterium]
MPNQPTGVSRAMAEVWGRRLRRAAIGAGMVALWAGGLAVRRHVVEFQLPDRGRPLPFTLESALSYRAIRMIYAGQGLPVIDRDLLVPVGVRTFAEDTVGAEYVYAALCRVLPADITLTDRIRWVSVGWFCLTSPLVVVWVRRMTGSWAAGFVAGGLHAVSLASVIRSTGQEISHENFALPWVLAHLAFCAGPLGAGGRTFARWAGAALMLAVALASWDLVQYVVAVQGLVMFAGWWRQPFVLREPRARPLLAVAAGVALAAVASPYHRVHGLIASPAVWPVWATLASAAVFGRFGRTQRWLAVLLAAAVVATVAAAGALRWAGAYGHFGSLAVAKLRHANRKPADPSRLTFEQRILWTPALHSADVRLFTTLFPAALPLTAIGALVMVRRRENLSGWFPSPAGLLLAHGVGVVMFILFVRFCVFAALSTCAVAGAWFAAAERWRPRARAGVAAALALAGLGEAGVTLGGAAEWGRTREMYPQLEELGEWLRRNAAPDPVLANFQTSPTVLAYGRCPILLHPKFESAEVRRRVETFARLLFLGTERELRDWAEGLGARWFVYSLGEFTPHHPELTLRYMVNALDPPSSAPARVFEFDPLRATRFRLEWQNAKYRVFRLVTAAEEAAADAWAERAHAAMERGDLVAAEAAAAEVFRRMPNHPQCRQLFSRIEAQRAGGQERRSTPPEDP